MRFHHGPAVDEDPALELAIAHALVRRAASLGGEALRIYRPADPVVVFGRRDTRLPGFPAAARAARAAGFEPLVRATGGRAVAYTSAALVVDHVRHDPDAVAGHERRFEELGSLLVDAFRDLGVDARLGAVPGEYCPGAFSVNARGTVKLVGTAQRIVKDAWLFSSLVVVGDQDRLRPVLAEVYGHLGQPFDVDSVGSLTGEVPSLDIDAVEAAVRRAYERRGTLDAQPVDEQTLALAHELEGEHRVPQHEDR